MTTDRNFLPHPVLARFKAYIAVAPHDQKIIDSALPAGRLR